MAFLEVMLDGFSSTGEIRSQPRKSWESTAEHVSEMEAKQVVSQSGLNEGRSRGRIWSSWGSDMFNRGGGGLQATHEEAESSVTLEPMGLCF